jgi:predicted dehydrogenase
VRIGILGAARIAPVALVRPARLVTGVEVAAIAARDPARAARFAERHGVPRVLPSYEALIEDDAIDAVYVALPNGLHGRYTEEALRAGKHVLCEKPFTANADEAAEVAAVAKETGRVAMEAFHYRYHPLFRRVLELVRGGAVGRPLRDRAALGFPLPFRSDIRFQLVLAGGAMMDVGCYPVHMLRHLAGVEPEVLGATAKLRSPGVDRAMTARLRFRSDAGGSAAGPAPGAGGSAAGPAPGAGGSAAGPARPAVGVEALGEVVCSLWSRDLLRASLEVVGDEGSVRVLNPMARGFHRLVLRTATERHVEHFTRRPTYAFQLEAFRDAVEEGAPVPTGPVDAVANMAVIDACYRAAGLEPRQPTP